MSIADDVQAYLSKIWSEDQAMATSKMHKNLTVWFPRYVADILGTILHTLSQSGGKLMSFERLT